jgi:hypothetical protein
MPEIKDRTLDDIEEWIKYDDEHTLMTEEEIDHHMAKAYVLFKDVLRDADRI